jgi:hypothetical protein
MKPYNYDKLPEEFDEDKFMVELLEDNRKFMSLFEKGGRLEFLTSNRFWALFIGALTIYLETKGWIGEAERNLLTTLMGGFVTVGTIDKFADKLKGEPQTTVNIPTSVSSTTTTTASE